MFAFPETLIVETLRWFSCITGYRPTDEMICWLGEQFPSLRNVPARMRDGRWLWLDLRNPVSIPYLLDADFPCERTETNLVRHITQPGDVTIDIGANLGWYASLLAREVKRPPAESMHSNPTTKPPGSCKTYHGIILNLKCMRPPSLTATVGRRFMSRPTG